MLIFRPYIVSTIFIVDMFGNTTIVDVYDIEVIYIDLEALYYELLLQELIAAFESISLDCQSIDNTDCDDRFAFGFGRDYPSNVIRFGDYRASRFDM
jgi:hypothetical protein